MTKFIFAVVASSLLLAAQECTGFTRPPSAFTGRAGSVCSQEELTTELSCPPTRTHMRRGSNLSMPPFLKKLGLKKPGSEKIEESTPTSVVIKEEEEKVKGTDEECVVPEEVEELSETKKLLKQVKEAGTAGVVSYALWELAFWAVSVPVCIFGYRELAGHWPDFSDQEDLQKLGAEAFAFVNFARFAVPLRIGLALSTTPWIQDNVIDKVKKEETPACEEPES